MSVSVIEKEKELLAPLLFAAVFFAGVFFPLLEDLAVLAMILLLLLFSGYESFGSVVRFLRHAGTGASVQRTGFLPRKGEKLKKKRREGSGVVMKKNLIIILLYFLLFPESVLTQGITIGKRLCVFFDYAPMLFPYKAASRRVNARRKAKPSV